MNRDHSQVILIGVIFSNWDMLPDWLAIIIAPSGKIGCTILHYFKRALIQIKGLFYLGTIIILPKKQVVKIFKEPLSCCRYCCTNLLKNSYAESYGWVEFGQLKVKLDLNFYFDF